jgi:hypothetical protein
VVDGGIRNIGGMVMTGKIITTWKEYILVPFVHHTYYKNAGVGSKWDLRPDR